MPSEHSRRTPTLDAGRTTSPGSRPAGRREEGPDLTRLEELLGDVLLEDEIARTPRAVVYRVRVGGRGDGVALKVASTPGDGEELARFAHEVRLLSEVHHPNVVEVYDWGVLPGGYPFMTLELLTTGGSGSRPGLGERLRAMLAEEGWDPFYDLALQAAAGLEHIHRQGLVHLDIKPDNLGLKEGAGTGGETDGEAGERGGPLHLKILDFGLARSLSDPFDPSRGRELRGTLGYMAPELLLQEGWDPRSDLYSLGMTLLELATGVLPSVGDTVAAEPDRTPKGRIESDVARVVRFHLEGEEVEPLRLRPDMPEPLAHILRRLLARDPGRRPASAGQLLAELAAAAGRPADSEKPERGSEVLLSGRMVGREDAMERLRTALEAAREGRGGLVLVEGEEGFGKSRLLWEFRLLAVLEGARVGRARSPTAHGEPLRPVAEALEGLGLGLPDLPEGGDGERPAWRLARQVAALLDPVHSSGSSVAADSPAAPVVLLLDDVHRATEETRELLALLAAELPGLPALVVATRRPPLVETHGPAGRDRLGEVEEVTLLPVLPLSAEDLAAMVRAGLGLEEVPEELITWLHRRSGGSPRHVQELLRHLISEEVLVWEAGEWRARSRELSRVAPPPGGAPELSWRRLVRCDGDRRRVLEALAVIGEPASLEELAALLGRDGEPEAEPGPEAELEPEQVWEALRLLLARGYLERVTEDRGRGPVWSFSQRRLRELVYAGMEGRERTRLHRRYAELLQSSRVSEAPPGSVAEHLWRAGEREAALPWLLAAAELAVAVHGYGEAAGLYSRAVEAAQAAGARETALRALVAEAEALTAAGRYPAALRTHQEILRSPEADLPTGFVARAWLEKGRLHARVGEQREALESYRAGLGRLESRAADVSDPKLAVDLTELEVELLHGEAVALRDLGERDQAFTIARSALQVASGLSGDRDRGAKTGEPLHGQRAHLLSTLAGLFYAQSDWRRAERLLRRALWVAETRAGDASLAARLRNNLGNVLWKTGSWERAEEIYRENLRLCERGADLWGRLTALNNLGILLASRGRWRAARDFLSESLAMKRRLGAWEAEALSRLNLAEAEEILGCWPAARKHLDRGFDLLMDQPDHPDRLALLVQLASLERKRGAGEVAEASVREALEGARRAGDPDLLARCWRLLGCLEKDRRRGDRARAYLARARETLEEGGTPEARVRLHLAWAETELVFGGGTAEGDDPGEETLERVEEHLRCARQDLQELGDPLAEGELWGLEAELEARRGRSETADEGFRRAVGRFEELGASFERAWGLYRWGLFTGAPEPARERLERAGSIFLELGAEGEARRVRGALEGLGEDGTERAQEASGGAGVLSQVMKVINSTLDLSEVLDRIMDRVLERLGAERGLIVLSDPLTGELTPAASRNLREGGIEERRLSESVVRRVIERGEPVVTVDALEDRRFSAVESIVVHQIRSILCVPLTIRDRRAGAIYVDHGTSRHLFGERECEFLLAFADQAAIAIDNARLYGELEEARRRLEEENESLRREVMGSHHLGRFIGRSPAIVELKKTLERVAVSGATVLLRGESGTGKGLVGRILHAISPRREEPFIHFNCAALPETLAESELFGHEKGAFTGAAGRKLGRFELAQGGTIFLDEIGKISHSIQAKLLRVVEEKIFERVGGTETLEADVRIIAATNLDLEEAIRRGEFREDLYYRLNIIPLTLPPLRQRKEDIPYLVQHFLERISEDLGRPAPELNPAVLELFGAHSWPGNVRELEATIHRALVLSPREVLGTDDFSWLGLGTEQGAATSPAVIPENLADGAYQEALDLYDRRLLEVALERCDGKLRETSRVLGISRNTLKAKLKRYEMR